MAVLTRTDHPVALASSADDPALGRSGKVTDRMQRHCASPAFGGSAKGHARHAVLSY